MNPCHPRIDTCIKIRQKGLGMPVIATEPLPTECLHPDGAKAEIGCGKVKKGSARIDEAKQMSKDFLSTHEVR